MKYYSVDRFEEEYAVLIDDGCASVTVLKSELPDGVKEGTVLRFENGKYSFDPDEEDSRRKRIFNLQNNLFKRKQ